jgi:hypothetical protein
VKRTKYINWILGFRQTTFVALFYYQVYENRAQNVKEYFRQCDVVNSNEDK